MPKLLLILALLGIGHLLNAQDGALWYFNPKIGPAGWPVEWLEAGLPKQTMGGLVVGSEVGIIIKKHIFSSSFMYGGPISPTNNSPKGIKTIDLSYGRYFGKRDFRFNYQAGLGIMYGDEILNEKTNQFNTLCLPVEFGIRLLSSFIGIGIDLQANLNAKHLYFAALLSLEFGKLKL